MKFFLGACVLIVAIFLMGYYFAVYVPEQRQFVADQKLANDRAGLIDCLESADEKYQIDWNANCFGENCSVTEKIAKWLDDRRVSDRITCQKLWGLD